ncbi:hypothetical protein [Cellulosimicrobium protaetiae]
MAKWLCTCGTVLRLSGLIPNPTEWLLVADTVFDEFHGRATADDVYAAAQHALRCPSCDRLYVFWSGLAQPPTVYARETEPVTEVDRTMHPPRAPVSD